MPAPAPVPEPVAEAKPEDVFKVTTGVGFRSALRLQRTDSEESDYQEKLDDLWLDELNVEPRFSGKVTDVVAWTANFTVSGRTIDSIVNGDVDGDGQVDAFRSGGGPIRFEVRALDLIGQLDFMDEFHVWMGRMLTPSDRSNFSGAWFMSPWNYPGSYFISGAGGAYIGPRGTEEIGREAGVTVWGNDKTGKFKYYVSALDLDNPELSPLFSGRLNVAFIGSEPGFYSSSTYYGSQNILALGVAGQYQKTSTTASDDELTEFNADLLGEFTVPGTGTFTAEAAYYHMDGPVFGAKDAWFGLLSYLTPNAIGIGKVQVSARFQQTLEPDRWQAEGFLTYVMKDYFAKIALGFTHIDTSDVELPTGGGVVSGLDANMIQLGFQIQQ